MDDVTLVVFENDSVMHQKSFSLGVARVSIRQLLILSFGVLMGFVVYSATDENYLVTGIFFALVLGIGMVNLSVMTPDQLLRSIILFLIRKTSLSKKPDYLKNNGSGGILSKNSLLVGSAKNKNKIRKGGESPTKNKNIIDSAISWIESFYKKDDSNNRNDDNDDDIDTPEILKEAEITLNENSNSMPLHNCKRPTRHQGCPGGKRDDRRRRRGRLLYDSCKQQQRQQ